MSRRRSLPTFALLLAVLLTSACAATAANKTPTVTPSPTATPILTPPALTIKPAHPLVWTAHQLPPGLKYTAYNWDGPAFSQADGETAYICNYVDGQAQVWATHDRAEHWGVAGSVVGAADSCKVIADQQDARRAIVQLFKSVPASTCCGAGVYTYYRTADGGASWTPITIPANDTPLIQEVATQGSTSHALASERPHSRCFCVSRLSISHDGMQTWSLADADIFRLERAGPTGAVTRFWLGSSGELLATVTNNIQATTYELWRSADHGAHWTQIGMGKSGVVAYVIVAENQGPHFWRMCAVYHTLGNYTHPPVQQISCTLDGGVTWLDTGGENSYDTGVLAQGTDGAILGVKKDGSLMRVAPGQTTWESLGTGGGVYVAGNGDGVLWRIGDTANYGDPLTTVYTAPYP